MNTSALDRDRIVFRRTHTHKGRRLSVTPANSAAEFLSYGRIILDHDVPEVAFDTGGEEVGLICLHGSAEVTVDDRSFPLGRYDAVYIPRDTNVTVRTGGQADIAECRAPVDGRYPLQYVPYANVVEDPGLHFKTGGPANTRTLNILLGKNIEAGRLVAGVTTSEPGHWTSWPPHEHTALLEEMYVYYDMPAPAFAVQFVYTDTENPERVEVVRDGDAMLMPAGYHPNVSVPGHTVSFIWIMAARREREDRLFGVVNVQPGFDQTPSGLDAGKK
ncbi:MAG: 5-deoxy-glucuronate isomerase [Vicinamibacterales bacterium]